MRHKNKQDSWRRLYVRLLTEPINADSLDGDDLILELNAIDDLIKAGYIPNSAGQEYRHQFQRLQLHILH